MLVPSVHNPTFLTASYRGVSWDTLITIRCVVVSEERKTMSETVHELEGVLVYEDQAELTHDGHRPAIVFDDGHLHPYDLDRLDDAGYRLYRVLNSTAHTKADNVPLYIFEEDN